MTIARLPRLYFLTAALTNERYAPPVSKLLFPQVDYPARMLLAEVGATGHMTLK
jgi:hypothetical protein